MFFYLGDSKTLLEAGFNNSYPIKITIHGFSDKGITSWTDVSIYIFDLCCIWPFGSMFS